MERRYNKVVPIGEKIDKITKYGRSYLSGDDLLSEAIYITIQKYNDIVIIGKDKYPNFISIESN